MLSNGSMKGLPPMTLGQRIKQLRKERGWTQRELTREEPSHPFQDKEVLNHFLAVQVSTI